MDTPIAQSFSSSVTAHDYARAAQLVASEAVRETNDALSVFSGLGHWLFRLLALIAGAAGLIALWYWSRSWTAAALAAIVAPVLYLVAERMIVSLMGWTERRLDNVSDRSLERSLLAQLKRVSVPTGDRIVRTGAGFLELGLADGNTIRFTAHEVDQIIRSDSMRLITRRSDGPWYEFVLPFPDDGLRGISPDEAYKALSTALQPA